MLECQTFGFVEACFQVALQCPMCGGEHRIMESNGEHYIKEAVCCNCGGKHLAAYKGCPKYVERQQIIQIKVDKNISYAEAVKVHRAPVVKEGKVVKGFSR